MLLRTTLIGNILSNIKTITQYYQPPTVFLENLATRLTERIKLRNQSISDGLPIPLTSRELEVVKHLATGLPISAIGNNLHVSMNTMKTHLRNIYRKLEVDGRDSAVEKAKELFLI